MRWFTRRSRTRLTRRTLFLAALGFAAVPFLAFLSWRLGLPHGDNPSLSVNARSAAHLLSRFAPEAYLTLAAGLAPAALWTVQLTRWTRTSWTLVGVAALCLLLVVIDGRALLGGYLTPQG